MGSLGSTEQEIFHLINQYMPISPYYVPGAVISTRDAAGTRHSPVTVQAILK